MMTKAQKPQTEHLPKHISIEETYISIYCTYATHNNGRYIGLVNMQSFDIFFATDPTNFPSIFYK
jgi:hypothetical protein